MLRSRWKDPWAKAMAAAIRPTDRLRLGHPSRLSRETQQLTLLVLGHLLVFFTSMSHDEIVAEMVSRGWVIANFAERFELLIGFCLFLCWSFLTLRLVALLQRVAHDTVEPEAKTETAVSRSRPE